MQLWATEIFQSGSPHYGNKHLSRQIVLLLRCIRKAIEYLSVYRHLYATVKALKNLKSKCVGPTSKRITKC